MAHHGSCKRHPSLDGRCSADHAINGKIVTLRTARHRGNHHV